MPKVIAKSAKPSKPRPDFPLFPHATRRWAKKIRGKLHYFGPWDDPAGALNKYLDQRDDLHAGRTPRVSVEGVTVADLCNRFVNGKKLLVGSGELSPRTFADYFATCGRIVAAFGRNRLVVDLATDDFERLRAGIAKAWGPVALGNEVQRIRTVFKWGYDAALIDRPVRFGPGFKRPSKKVLRQARQAKGLRMFEAKQLRQLLEKADQPLKSMILLGINCGFGNNDVATLPTGALDLKAGWLKYPRPKTALPRRVPLWKETIKALREAKQVRPSPRRDEDAGLVFITKYGAGWAKSTSDNPVTKEFRKLLDECKLHRPGLGFYTLRHTFETIAGDTADQVAVNAIMGHAPASNDMSAVYRERVSDERLQRVVNHVRAWLFTPETKSRRPKPR